MLVLICSTSYGQIVNIENQRLGIKKNGWSGTDDFTFNFTKNTKEIWQIGNILRLNYKQDKHSLLMLSEINFVKAGQSDFVNNGFEHLRYNYELTDSGRFVFEAFRQTQYSKVQNIRIRSLYGTGFRVVVLNQDSAQVSLGVLPMAEFEDLTDGTNNKHIRLSSYLAFDFQFNKNIGVNSITYYQPDIIYWNDFRIANTTSFRFKINSYLSWRVIFNLNYDEFPSQSIPQGIWSLRNAVRFKF